MRARRAKWRLAAAAASWALTPAALAVFLAGWRAWGWANPAVVGLAAATLGAGLGPVLAALDAVQAARRDGRRDSWAVAALWVGAIPAVVSLAALPVYLGAFAVLSLAAGVLLTAVSLVVGVFAWAGAGLMQLESLDRNRGRDR